MNTVRWPNEIEAIIVSERDNLNAGGTLYYVKWNKD